MSSKDKFLIFLSYWDTLNFCHIANPITNRIEYIFIVRCL